MAKSSNLFKREKSYHVYIFYGLDPRTIERLNIKYFEVSGARIDSPQFTKLVSEITDFSEMIEEDMFKFNYYQAASTSYLFYSEIEENIHDLYYFLTLFRPSKISWWMNFKADYRKMNVKVEKKHQHVSSGYGIWKDIHALYNNLEIEDIFYLHPDDCVLINKIIPKYAELSKKPIFQEAVMLYHRAYREEDLYFKYLLLFMTIESLIVDNETTGVNYKVRRLSAVLVGEDSTQCENIYKVINEAYNIRSAFVHSGKSKLDKTNYYQFLHSVVCELLIVLLLVDTNTDNIFKVSTTIGFGQRKLLFKDKTFTKLSNLLINKQNFNRKMK